MRRIHEFARDKKGATVIEYGLIVALIVIAMMASLNTFANQVVGLLNHVSNEVANTSRS